VHCLLGNWSINAVLAALQQSASAEGWVHVIHTPLFWTTVLPFKHTVWLPFQQYLLFCPSACLAQSPGVTSPPRPQKVPPVRHFQFMTTSMPPPANIAKNKISVPLVAILYLSLYPI